MRLPEAQIREALTHPLRLARTEALRYFADSYSRDLEVMPRAIQAIVTYGRREAFQYDFPLRDLAQTEATVAWAIRELNQPAEPPQLFDPYPAALSQLLCHADPKLLVPHEREIIEAAGFSKERILEFQERLRLLDWDADRCWKELEDIAERGSQEETDWGHAERVVEALARQAGSCTDRILDLLGRKPDLDRDDPLIWMEIFLAMLSGEMRLQPAVPQLVAKLHYEEAEVLWEECVTALVKIGGEAAVDELTRGWADASWDYRLYAAGGLEDLHTDLTVQKCLKLLPTEKDAVVRTNLAAALLATFATEAIEPVRQLVQQRKYDPQTADLTAHLVAVSTVLGVSFPEYEIWKRQAEEGAARVERRIRALEEDVEPLPPFPAAEPEEYVGPAAVPYERPEAKVGRNDLCPCGSGKKFKKCCMNNR